MADPVSLPFWLVALLSILAIIALVDRIFAPSVKWYFRRRVNDAIDELNNRLDLQIQPFKLTRRQGLIDQLLYDPDVIQAVDAEHLATGKPRAVIMKQAQRYATEIVPSFSPLTYFGIGTKVAKWMSEFAYRVRLGYTNDEAFKEVPKNAAVVFVMNHRSNMDYVLVTYLASKRASLSYAVGEWAQVIFLHTLLRSMGAYFIRRNSKNQLYRRVLAAYVRKATKEGVTQAVFPEGGLSRDGTLGEPKLGLLSYMVSGFQTDGEKDIVFIPVGINYDRVMEDRILTAKQEKEATGRDFRVKIQTVFSFIWNLIKLRFQGRLYRYGHACVSFGKPVSLNTFARENKIDFSHYVETGDPVEKLAKDQRFAGVQKLGEKLLSEIGAIIPALPVAMVATILLQNEDHWMSDLELKAKVFDLIKHLENTGGHVHIPREDRDYTLDTGIRMLKLRHILQINSEGLYRANPKEHLLLMYYTNSIAHLLKSDTTIKASANKTVKKIAAIPRTKAVKRKDQFSQTS
ncbi:MAG: 1-acyl-sn-glycerol-3-phosphate acyltransferase [Salaquimonas sp.]